MCFLGSNQHTNIKKFLSDPDLWFLNSSGPLFRPDDFVPLGHERRMGETLARVELSIFLVCPIQKLRLQTVPGNVPDLTY